MGKKSEHRSKKKRYFLSRLHLAARALLIGLKCPVLKLLLVRAGNPRMFQNRDHEGEGIELR